MLFSILASIFAVAAETAPVTLVIESSNTELNGQGISAFHEEATLSTAFIASLDKEKKYPLQQDLNTGEIYFQANPSGYSNFYLGELDNTLTYSNNRQPVSVDSKCGYLAINGSTNVFYTCPNYVPLDEMHYAQSGYKGVSIFAQGEDHPSDCEAIKFKIEY